MNIVWVSVALVNSSSMPMVENNLYTIIHGIPFRTKISNVKSSNEVDMNCKMSRISKLQKCKD